jgi:hypothetical protein
VDGVFYGVNYAHGRPVANRWVWVFKVCFNPHDCLTFLIRSIKHVLPALEVLFWRQIPTRTSFAGEGFLSEFVGYTGTDVSVAVAN